MGENGRVELDGVKVVESRARNTGTELGVETKMKTCKRGVRRVVEGWPGTRAYKRVRKGTKTNGHLPSIRKYERLKLF